MSGFLTFVIYYNKHCLWFFHTRQDWHGLFFCHAYCEMDLTGCSWDYTSLHLYFTLLHFFVFNIFIKNISEESATARWTLLHSSSRPVAFDVIKLSACTCSVMCARATKGAKQREPVPRRCAPRCKITLVKVICCFLCITWIGLLRSICMRCASPPIVCVSILR